MKDKRVAASVKYKEGDRAPKVTAYGEGTLADRIMKLAADAGVPSYEDEELAKRLGRVGIGKEIPPELYEVVAEVLSFIYWLDFQKGDERNVHKKVGR